MGKKTHCCTHRFLKLYFKHFYTFILTCTCNWILYIELSFKIKTWWFVYRCLHVNLTSCAEVQARPESQLQRGYILWRGLTSLWRSNRDYTVDADSATSLFGTEALCRYDWKQVLRNNQEKCNKTQFSLRTLNISTPSPSLWWKMKTLKWSQKWAVTEIAIKAQLSSAVQPLLQIYFFPLPRAVFCTKNGWSLVESCFQARSSLRTEAWHVPASPFSCSLRSWAFPTGGEGICCANKPESKEVSLISLVSCPDNRWLPAIIWPSSAKEKLLLYNKADTHTRVHG